MYTLDTNTLIYFFKGQGEVSKHMLNIPPEQITISAIVQYEIETGIAKSLHPEKRQHQFRELTNIIDVLSFDTKAAEHSAAARAYLEKAGTPIGPYDILIAGTALANNKILVTHNTREFNRIPNLRIEDWWE